MNNVNLMEKSSGFIRIYILSNVSIRNLDEDILYRVIDFIAGMTDEMFLREIKYKD